MANCETGCQFRGVGGDCRAIGTLGLHPRSGGLLANKNCTVPFLTDKICPISIAMLDLSQNLTRALGRLISLRDYGERAIEMIKRESEEIPDPHFPHLSRVYPIIVEDLMKKFGMSQRDALATASSLEQLAGITYEADTKAL